MEGLAATSSRPVAGSRRSARRGPSLLGQPSLQAVGPEVALHDEVGRPVVSQALEPSREQRPQRGLTDADRWVRPDAVERDARRQLVGCHHLDVGQPGLGCVSPAQVPGPGVDLDGPHRRRRVAGRQCHRDRPVPGSDVGEVVIAIGRGRPSNRSSLVPESMRWRAKTPASVWRVARRSGSSSSTVDGSTRQPAPARSSGPTDQWCRGPTDRWCRDPTDRWCRGRCRRQHGPRRRFRRGRRPAVVSGLGRLLARAR